jgi:hypothetical protein
MLAPQGKRWCISPAIAKSTSAASVIGMLFSVLSKTSNMSDNKNLNGPQDSSRINVHEDYELRYWSEKFGVSKAELQKAVDEVGVSATKVEQYLKDAAKKG